MANKQLRSFLTRFLPVALIILLGSFYYHQNLEARLLNQVKSQEALNVGLGSASLLRPIQMIVGDLTFLAEHYALQRIVNVPDSPEIFRLEINLQSLVKIRQVYDQVRWLDRSGQEKVRVDLVNGEPSLVPANKLQNKGDRYYFTEAMQKNDRQPYISPLDLNVENGKIEEPYKPMLRLAMPVADQQGVKQGILIINYLADEMIQRFVADSTKGNASISLLDSTGYWLHSANEADAWGFMFKDASRSLASRLPGSWAKMQGSSGQFDDENGLWTFARVYPLGSANEYHWLVVSHLNNKQLSAALNHSETERFIVTGLLLLLLGGVIFYIQRSKSLEAESEKRFRAIFDYAMVGIATTSPNKGWITVNPALCRIFGYAAEELKEKTWAELTHPDDIDNNLKKFEGVLRGESDGYSMEKRFFRKDGSVLHSYISARAIRAADGSVDYFVLIVEDLSNWILAENQWAASVDTLQRFIDHLPGVAFVKDAEANVLIASRHNKIIESFGAANNAAEQCVLKTGVAEVVESEVDGSFYESTNFPIPRIDGTTDLGCITLDVTDRHRVQLKLAQQMLRSAVMLELPNKAESLPEKAFMQYALERAEELTNSEIGFMHFVNDDEATIELVAWSSSTLKKYCTAAFDCHYPITEAGIWADAAREKRPVVINDYATAPNKHGLPAGHSALIRLLSIPVMESGKVVMMTGVGNKANEYSDYDVETVQLIGNEAWRIVRRNRAELALKQATQVVNASPVICYRARTIDGWPMVFVSENVRQWGYTPEKILAGQPPVHEIIHPDDLPRLIADAEHNFAVGISNYEQEYRLLTSENRVIWVLGRTAIKYDAEGKPEFFDGVLSDITERRLEQAKLAETLAQQRTLNKRLEDANNQLLQSEKMASIGQLAAGVAHELNNPIGFVHSNLGTLDGYLHDLMAIITAYEKETEITGKTVAAVHRIMEECDYAFLKEDIFSLLGESKDGLGRVRKIVQDLKSFSRVGEQEWQVADLHQGLDSTLNIVWNELKYKCKVVKEYGEIPHVYCLISQINQVFMNLLVNASHAIETQGTITIRTRQTDENWVCVEVSDTGKGIAPEHITRIFEPFFTTKPVGKGTGLGLSLSYSIIQRHGGRIEVDSQIGIGSNFRLLLPISPPADHIKQDSEISS